MNSFGGRYFLIWGILLFICSCEGQVEDNRRNEDLPNVIVVLTDDQGYGDLSVHGNPILETPVLDRLHEESVRFTDFHVAPMCTPTRGQLLTGRDAMDNGATRVNSRSMMREELPTMADIFKASGYHTAHFGKWHLGDSYPHRPQDRGFDKTVHHGAWGVTSMADHYGNDYWDDSYLNDGELEKFEGYCTDVWFDLTLDYIKQQKEKDDPFFVYLATNAPHSPHWVDEEYSDPFLEKGVESQQVAGFLGQIANIDDNMNRLLETLDETGLTENTILIFMTDNGSARGSEIFNAGMRGSKTDPYEGGHRVPLFLRWPGGDIGEPRDIGELTQVQDLLPTLIELAGMNRPENVEFDGVSLTPLLKNEADELDDRMIVIEYENPYRPQENKAVLWGDWRLVKNSELYNLSTDPSQENDLSDEYPRIAARMEAHYEKWKTNTMPDYGKKKFIHIGNERQNPLMLYSSDWHGTYADGLWNLFDGDDFGSWEVMVDTPGKYEFTLYRWHPAAEIALDDSYRTVEGEEEGDAIPVSLARLKIGDTDQTVETPSGSTEAKFTVDLKKGANRVETWFMDGNKNILSSAYYTEVKLID